MTPTNINEGYQWLTINNSPRGISQIISKFYVAPDSHGQNDALRDRAISFIRSKKSKYKELSFDEWKDVRLTVYKLTLKENMFQ